MNAGVVLAQQSILGGALEGAITGAVAGALVGLVLGIIAMIRKRRAGKPSGGGESREDRP